MDRWDQDMHRKLMTRAELERLATDYFDIADQENLTVEQKDRLRRAAIALSICAEGK